MYTKTRKAFGRHARFEDEPSEVRKTKFANPESTFTPFAVDSGSAVLRA
jgi:hypothetical protein